ncbi:MAG: family PLP-dependent enzyme [Devosia sp.]|nr:family PLP-dependent enzyme [Devosia sp.]
MAHGIGELDTPCVLIDLDRVMANIARAQAHADANGLKLRPHVKTHKLPQFAKLQVEAGAVGITVQKLGEAEVMAEAGLNDLFLPYNIVGPRKLARLQALNQRVSLAVTADSEATLAGYSATFADTGKPLRVFIECDTGGGRCGVPTPDRAVLLARKLIISPGLVFEGLMTYPPAGRLAQSELWLSDALELFDAAGIPVPAVSSGNSPDMWRLKGGVVTEARPGTYIYFDRYQVEKGAATFEDCALTVLATVVSRPNGTRAVLDAGSKTLSSDLLGLEGFGYIGDYPEAIIKSLSEEHAVVELPAASAYPRIGDTVRIIPNHACVVSNLFDAVHVVQGGAVIETLAVAARGRVD